MNGLTEKAGRVVAALQKAKQTLATAESCTGGLIAASITAVPGSSTCFGYGVVSYSNQAKMDVLRVQAQTLARFGAVSEQTAYEMAQGGDVALEIDTVSIDLIPQALELARMGILPEGMYRNRQFAQCAVEPGDVDLAVQDMRDDPPTAPPKGTS